MSDVTITQPRALRPARRGWRGSRLLPAVLPLNGNSFEAHCWRGHLVRLRTLFSPRSSGNTVRIGSNAHMHGLSIRIDGEGNTLEMGENVTWRGRINISGVGLTVRIGDRCDAKGVRIFARDRDITIGSDCLFARDIEIRSSDVHRILDRDTGEILNPPHDVEIGSRVWVGAGVLISKGALVAPGCVLGARSLIAKAYDQPDCVLAGAPAAIIRENVEWRR